MFFVELIHKSLDLCVSLKSKVAKKIKESPAAYYTNMNNLRNLPTVRKFMCNVGRHKFESTDPEDNVMTCSNCSVKKVGI